MFGLKRYFPGASGALQQSRKGTTATEMALLTPIFFLLLIGITEICLILGAQQLLENAAFNASRLAKTGYITTGSTQAQTVTKVVIDELGSFGSMFDPSRITTSEVAYNDFSNIGGNNTGTSGYGTAQQIVVYTITYSWKLFTPLMGQLIGTWDPATSSYIINLTSRIVVRNEPYG